MTTNPSRPCRAVKPSECPYHGALNRMEAALESNNISGYMTAKSNFDKAAADKLAALTHRLPSAPVDAYYEYVGEKMLNQAGVELYRIKATADIPEANVKKGDVGGWVDPRPLANERLRISGGAWVSGDAQVYGEARIEGGAQISGYAQVFGKAVISRDAQVFGDAWVSGDAWVRGKARVSGDAWVKDNTVVSGSAYIGN